MTEMLELPDTIFEAAMIIILQQAIMNTLKWKKMENLSKEIEELSGSLQLKISILLTCKSLIFFRLVSSIQLLNNWKQLMTPLLWQKMKGN